MTAIGKTRYAVHALDGVFLHRDRLVGHVEASSPVAARHLAVTCGLVRDFEAFTLKIDMDRCQREGCDLPAERDGLCEPCWESGRDWLDAALGEGRR